MTIRENDVGSISVAKLLDENLRIPHYQRPYSWEPATALQLVDDIQQAMKDEERRDVPYVLGAVILHQVDQQLDVVDGQQRLLTLRMILMLLDAADGAVPDVYADNPIGRVRKALRLQIATIQMQQRGELADFIRHKCQVVRVVTDDIDEAFRVFDSQNYRGKPLAPHDLLKAHHLREMRDETVAMKAAVVEAWESVKDADLVRLFSIYLYRITKWSRGESAPGFTIHDIGMFKGISLKDSRLPSARYHVAAQVALPMLNAWATSGSDIEHRDISRIRFQLDAPLLAGRPFFDMVAFMLPELRRLAVEAFSDERADFSLYGIADVESGGLLIERPSRSRYRYVSELYLAALLYYTNKFGEEGLASVLDRLFSWAYSLRIGLLRVQFRSIDNHARGEQGAFAFILMRHAESGTVVRQLLTASTSKNEKHEKKLFKLINKLGM